MASHKSRIESALLKAELGFSNIESSLLTIPGMSGMMYRMFINNLLSSMADARYLEIGCWTGSTLCSALNGNIATATAIDNWSEFGGPKGTFQTNVEKYITPSSRLTFIESDFRAIDYTQLGKFNVFLYDGPHTVKDQEDGITIAYPALEDQFILVVDDWNWIRVREGTFGALIKMKSAALFEKEIRSTWDNTHPTNAGPTSDWHNGYYIAVIQK